MGLFLDGTNNKIYNDVWHNLKILNSTATLTPILDCYNTFIAVDSSFSLHCEWAGRHVEEISLSHDSISVNDFNISFIAETSTITLTFLQNIQLAQLTSGGLTFTIKFTESDILGYLTIKFSSQGSPTNGQYHYGVTFSFNQGASGTKSIDLGNSVMYTSFPASISKAINESNVTSFTVDAENVRGYIKGINFEGKSSDTFFQGADYFNRILIFGDTRNLVTAEAELIFSNKQFSLINFKVIGGGEASVTQFMLDDVPITYKYGYSASTNSWNILKYYNSYEDAPIWFDDNTKINGFLTVAGEVK